MVGIGVDVGGTKIAGAVVARDGSVLARRRVESPAADADAIVIAIGDVIVALREEAAAHVDDPLDVPACVGAAGLIDLDGVVRYAPNIVWADLPLRAQLVERLGGAVRVVNDGSVAAYGEFRAGAAQHARASAAMITLGTGVGGGLVLDSRLAVGGGGLGGEFGHMIVCEGGRQCPCGNRGCLEAYASGNAIGAFARERRDAGDVPSGSPLHDVEDLTGVDVTRAAAQGDEAAIDVLRTVGTWLGVGVASLVNALDPEIVMVGGGAVAAGDLLLEPARTAYHARLTGRGHREPAPLVPASLGGDAGVIGAALLAIDEA